MRSKALVLTLATLGILTLACGGSDSSSEGTTTTTTVTLAGSGTKSDPYQVDCNNSGKDLTGNVGDSFFAQCPSGCTSGSVWGTGPYTRDSRICSAAIHAGATNSGGGLVKVSIAAGAGSYDGSDANGVTSRSWGAYDTSINVEAPGPKKAGPGPAGGGAPVAGGAGPAASGTPEAAPAEAPAAAPAGGGAGARKGGKAGRGR